MIKKIVQYSICNFRDFLDHRALKKLSNTTPLLNLEEFYQGNLKAHGVARSPLGKLCRRFSAEVTGRKAKNGSLNLVENFTYSDGRKFHRQWVLNPMKGEKKGIYSGAGKDIHGNISAKSSGCAALLRYSLKIPKKGSSNFKTLNVKHWQYQISDTKTLHFLNLSKWGITILNSTVIFERP